MELLDSFCFNDVLHLPSGFTSTVVEHFISLLTRANVFLMSVLIALV